MRQEDTGKVMPRAARPLISVLAGSGLLIPTAAVAQHADPEILTLPTVTVVGEQSLSPSLSRLTEPLLDTPQTIIEVPAQQARDQGAESLEDAVRYVPGIS